MTDKKQYIALILSLVLGLFSSANVTATTTPYAGAFLDNHLGVKSISMGNAFTSVSDDTTALYTNPAGLSTLGSTLQGRVFDIMETQSHSIEGSTELMGVGIGIGYISTRMDGIEETIQNGQTLLNTGKTFSYQATAITIGAGYTLSKQLSIGMSAKIIQEKLQNNSASGVGLDIGILYRLKKGQFLNLNTSNTTTIGVTLKNIIEPNITWNTASKAAYKIPKTLCMGLSTRLFNDSTLVSIDAQKKGTNDITLHAGIAYSIHPLLHLRAGINNGSLSIGTGLQLDNLWLNMSLSLPKGSDSEILDTVYRVGFGIAFD